MQAYLLLIRVVFGLVVVGRAERSEGEGVGSRKREKSKGLVETKAEEGSASQDQFVER